MDKCVAIIVAVTILGQVTGRTYHSYINCDENHGHHPGFHHSFNYPDPKKWHHGPSEWEFPEPTSHGQNQHFHRHNPHKHFEDQDNQYFRADNPAMWDDDRWVYPGLDSLIQAWNMRDQRTTAPPVATTPSTVSIQSCIRSCPVTPEYNPVCGTNNITYTNPGRLECAKYCGVDVQMKRSSACPTAPTNNNNIPSSTSTSTSRPTFTNPTVPTLSTTDAPTPTVGPTNPTLGPTNPTFGPTNPTLGPTNANIVPTNPNRNPDMSIPQSVLDSIFSIPEEDPNYDIDVRTRNMR